MFFEFYIKVPPNTNDVFKNCTVNYAFTNILIHTSDRKKNVKGN